MDYQYFGLFLNEHYRNELMKIIFANPIITNLVLQRGSTLYLDHCTLLHKNQNDKEIYDSLVKSKERLQKSIYKVILLIPRKESGLQKKGLKKISVKYVAEVSGWASLFLQNCIMQILTTLITTQIIFRYYVLIVICRRIITTIIKKINLGQCWNWQTGMVQAHVPQGVRVRVPPTSQLLFNYRL